MTPKQKKVSLNAGVLRSILGCEVQLRIAVQSMEEAFKINPESEKIKDSQYEKFEIISYELSVLSQRLKKLEPLFRSYANFHPKSKFEREMDKLTNEGERK